MVTNPQPDMGTMGQQDGGVSYTIQMHPHPMQDPQVPVGYEHYFMQMHLARLQAEAAAPPPLPQMQPLQTAFVGQDGMGQWLPPPPQQQHLHHNNGQAPGPGV